MSHPARLSLRAPPHLPFIQGWPGIPGSHSRRPPGIHGTVELRLTSGPLKAKWVRVELRKYELLPSNITPQSGANTCWDHVGEIVHLWQSGTKEWDNIETTDFKFFLPLPDTIPPTVELPKGGMIRYELVAALCYRQKGGILKKESAPILKISEPIRITKHELHSAWPLYNLPETRVGTAPTGSVSLTVSRPNTAFGPNDRILLTASLKSLRPSPFKLKGFETTLTEILVITSSDPNAKRKSKPPPPKSRVVASSRTAVNESVGKGGEKSARIEVAIPVDIRCTVKNARMIDVTYELEIKAVCDGLEGPKVALKYVVGPFSRPLAQQAVRDIGMFEPLCPPQPGAPSSITSSDTLPRNQNAQIRPNPSALGQPEYPPVAYQTRNPGSPPPTNRPQQMAPIQGFAPRADYGRRSSAGSTATTATQELASPTPQNGYRPGPVAFPTPNRNIADQNFSPSPDPSLGSTRNSPQQRYGTISDVGHDTNRYSTGTEATFGKWDKALRTSADEARGPNRTLSPPPSTRHPLWQSAEAEKTRLYDLARARAVETQSASGASLERIGLGISSEIPSIAPPEYAPPLPAPLVDGYKAPERPVSVYSLANERGSTSTPKPEERKIMSGRSSLSNGLGDSSPPPLSPSIAQIPYKSAEQEKDRARYQRAVASREQAAADSRAVDISPSPSGSGPHDEPPIAYDAIFGRPSENDVGSLQSRPTGGDKDQIKRFYDAQDNVAKAANRSSSSPAAGSSSNAQAVTTTKTPTSTAKAATAYMSAMDEKEMMKKRYEEATSRVAVTQGLASPSTPPPPSPSISAGPSAVPAMTFMSAAEEKEMMKKRFEEATSRVAVAQRSISGPGPSIEPPSRPQSVMASSSNAPSYMSAADEKEIMRRRFEEASLKVAARSVSGGMASPPLSPVINSQSPRPGPTTASGPAGPSYMSAAEEKEMMRKRFEEATSRVNNAQRSVSSPLSPAFEIPPKPQSTIASSSVSLPAAYMSAAEEKEMMRRRFEEATSRVTNAARRSTSTSGSTSCDQPPDTPPPSEPTPSGSQHPMATKSYPSAADEKEVMRKRYEEATSKVSSASQAGASSQIGLGRPSSTVPDYQSRSSSTPGPTVNGRTQTQTHTRNTSMVSLSSPPDSPLIRDPMVKAGKARATGTSSTFDEPEGPPPPLPARPPAEYIRLLSPVPEVVPSIGATLAKVDESNTRPGEEDMSPSGIKKPTNPFRRTISASGEASSSS